MNLRQLTSDKWIDFMEWFYDNHVSNTYTLASRLKLNKYIYSTILVFKNKGDCIRILFLGRYLASQINNKGIPITGLTNISYKFIQKLILLTCLILLQKYMTGTHSTYSNLFVYNIVLNTDFYSHACIYCTLWGCLEHIYVITFNN